MLRQPSVPRTSSSLALTISGLISATAWSSYSATSTRIVHQPVARRGPRRARRASVSHISVTRRSSEASKRDTFFALACKTGCSIVRILRNAIPVTFLLPVREARRCYQPSDAHTMKERKDSALPGVSAHSPAPAIHDVWQIFYLTRDGERHAILAGGLVFARYPLASAG